MVSGFLLYDVIDSPSGLGFTSSDDVHTMAHLYESMLREMRDVAVDSGEFYTPRRSEATARAPAPGRPLRSTSATNSASRNADGPRAANRSRGRSWSSMAAMS